MSKGGHVSRFIGELGATSLEASIGVAGAPSEGRGDKKYPNERRKEKWPK
jgi:hypothetical protein